jgi:monoamine oxidase
MTLEAYQEKVKAIIQNSKYHYNQVIVLALSQHRSQGIFKYAVMGVLQQVYQDLLSLLESSELEECTTKEALTAAYENLLNDIISHALHTHRTSCALSNFGDEHRPSERYIEEVRELAQVDWNKFKQKAEKIVEFKIRNAA